MEARTFYSHAYYINTLSIKIKLNFLQKVDKRAIPS